MAISTAEYPFRATPLTPDDVAFVEREAQAAEAEDGLLGPRPILTVMTSVFLKHCSPPTPARDALAAVTRLLRIVLYFNDRLDKRSMLGETTAAWDAIVRPERAPGAARGVAGAAAKAGRLLRDAMGARRAEGTSFAHLLRVNFAAFVSSVSEPHRPRSVAEHLALRSETISAAAYLRLWGLLGGLTPASEMRFGLRFAQLERASAVVQALANDLRSVARDRVDGEPNAVLVEAEARACPLPVAEEAVRRLHDQTLEELVAGLSAVREAAGDRSDAVGYCEFIGICTRGNSAAMDELVTRYRRPNDVSHS